MFWKTQPLSLPTAAEALPGREQALPTAQTHFISGLPLKGPYPEGMAQVILALGCFWGAERLFWQREGVWITAVGYVDGITPNPTYEEVCSGRTGHTEAVLVVHDPERVSLEDLLRLFSNPMTPRRACGRAMISAHNIAPASICMGMRNWTARGR